MTDTGTETPRNLLPLPTQEESLNDFLPSPSNTNESSSFWQALTGHPRVFSDISPFFDGNGKLTLPQSESQWKTQESVLGQQPEDLLHPSWLGVHDDLRIYVLTPDAMRTMKERLQTSGMQVSSFASDIGIGVERHIPSWKKENQPRTFLQGLLGKNKERLTKDPNRLKTQHVFFISADRLQTPMDTLALADEIRRLHPETAERLTLDLLLKLKTAQENAAVWQHVLQSYPENSVPDYLRETFTDTQAYVNRLKTDLNQWIQKAQQKLGGNISDLPEILQQELQQRTFFFRSQSEESIRDTMKRIIERYRNLPQQEQQERTQTFVDYLLRKSIQETTRVSLQAREKLNQDPKQWLLEEVMIRGKERLLDTLPPSAGMIEYAQTRGIPPEHIRSVREWLRACRFREQFQHLRRKLLEAQHVKLSQEQQQTYQTKEQEIQQKIQEIQEKHRNATDHPILANFSEIQGILANEQNEEVKKKLQAVWEAKRDLAKAQMDITNLFLQTTAKDMIPGKGYEGWNRAKLALQVLLESAPLFITETGELNCAGRVMLVSSMLLETDVFSQNDIVIMNTHGHTFLGGFDEFGLGRLIEPSGISLKNSYFGIPRIKIFRSKASNQKEVITQHPLDIGLMISVGENFIANLRDEKMTYSLLEWILKKTNYQEISTWHNLSVSLHKQSPNSLDWIVMATRAVSMNDQFLKLFYLTLSNFYRDAKHALPLSRKNKNTDLLPYLKLSLLITQQALNDETKRKELEKRLNIKHPDINLMIKNLDHLYYSLLDIPFPFSLPNNPNEWANHIRANHKQFGISEEDARSMSDEELVQQFLWNPDLFPKPIAIKEDGSIEWKMPEQR